MAERVSLEGLRYAQAVSETGSFSAAARAYGVTQPSLSNGVAKLERTLGERLFDRSPRGVTPTAFGARILPLLSEALRALDGITAEANRWRASGEEPIRLGVSPLINPSVVAGVYSAVCGAGAEPAPRQLVLHEGNMAELQDALIAGDLDLLLIPSVGPLPRFEPCVIDSEPVVLVESKPTDDDPIELAELAGRQLILIPDTCGLTTFTRDLFTSHGMPVQAYPGEASSYRVLEEWARLGLGSALIPRSRLATADAPHRTLHDEGTETEIFYAAVWDPNSGLASDLRALAQRLRRPTA